MRKLGEEVRRGVDKTHPMTEEQKKAVGRITERIKREQKSPTRKQDRKIDRDHGQDIEM